MNSSDGFMNGRPLSSPSVFTSESASPTSPIESGCCRYPRSKSVNSLFYKNDKTTNSIKQLPKFTWAIFKGKNKLKKTKEPKNDRVLKKHPVKKVTSWQFVQPDAAIDIPANEKPMTNSNKHEGLDFDARTVLTEQRMQTFTIVPTKVTPPPTSRIQLMKIQTPPISLRRQVLDKDLNTKNVPVSSKDVPRSPGPLDGSLYTQVKKRKGETDESDVSSSNLSLNKDCNSNDEMSDNSSQSLSIKSDKENANKDELRCPDDSSQSSPLDNLSVTAQTNEYENVAQNAEASLATLKYTVNDIANALQEECLSDITSSAVTSHFHQDVVQESANSYTRTEILHDYDNIQGQDDKPEDFNPSNNDVTPSNNTIASKPSQDNVEDNTPFLDRPIKNLDSGELPPHYVAIECSSDSDHIVNVNEPTAISQISTVNMLQPSSSNHLTQLDVDNAMALVNECLADTEERGYRRRNSNVNDYNGNSEPPEFTQTLPDYPALQLDTRFEEKGPEYALPVRDVVLGTIPARKAILVSNTSTQQFLLDQADLENNNTPPDPKNIKINDPLLDGNGYLTIEDINTINIPASKQFDNVSDDRNDDAHSVINSDVMDHVIFPSINASNITDSMQPFNVDKTEHKTLPQPRSTQSPPPLASPTLSNTSGRAENTKVEEPEEDEEERRVREEIENTRKKLLDLENKHNTLKRRKGETKEHSFGHQISPANNLYAPTPNHVTSALQRPPGHRPQLNPKPINGQLSDNEQQEIDELLRSVQDLDILTLQRDNDVIVANEQHNFASPKSVTMVTTALTADPATQQNINYSRYHDNANRRSPVGVFTPAYAHPMHQPQHMERQHLQTQLQLQKKEENSRKQQKEDFVRQQRAVEYEQQKLLQEQRQREYNRQKELELERKNQYESHLLVQKQQEREFMIQERKRQEEREKQDKFQLQFDQRQRILQEKQQYVTQPPPEVHVDRFPKDEIEKKAMQLEIQRRTSLSMEALEARVAVASQPQLVTPQALGHTSQTVKSDDLQLQLDELDKYIQQLTQPSAEPLAVENVPTATTATSIPQHRNSEVVRRNRRSFTVELERKMDPNIPLSPNDLVNTSMFVKEEPPRPPSRTLSSYNSVRRHSHGFELAQMIQTEVQPEFQTNNDKNDDVFSPVNSNPSYPPQSSKTRPPQQKVLNAGYTPLLVGQPSPSPKKSVSLEERLSPQLFLAMTVNPGARPIEDVHSYKEDQVEEQRVEEVDSAPPQTPGFPVSPKTPYINLSSPVPSHVAFTKTPLSTLGLKPNDHPQRAIDDVSSSDSDVTSNNTQDRSLIGSETRRPLHVTEDVHMGSPLDNSANVTNDYNNRNPQLKIKETNLLPTNSMRRLEEQQQSSIHQAYSSQSQGTFHGYTSQQQSYPINNNSQSQQLHPQQNGWHGNKNKAPWIHASNGHSPTLNPTSENSFSTLGQASSLGSGGVSPSGSISLTGSNDSLLSDGSGGSHNNSSTGGVYQQRHPSLPPKESSIRNSGSSLRSTSTAGSGYLGGASQTSPQSAGSAGSPSSTTGHYPFTQPPMNKRESQLSAYERHGSMHNTMSSDDGGLNSPGSGRTSTSSISDIDKLAHELSMSSLSGATPPKFIRDTTSYWYKPDITREQALAMLRDRSAGSFVVRNSRCYPGAFGLALKVDQVPQAVLATAKPGTNMSGELVRHFLIEPSTRGVKLKGCANEPVFGSLSALIYQHSITPLALPCKLTISTENQKVPQLSGSSRNSAEVSNSAAELLRQGAACNVLYLGSADTESLTGPEAIERAMRERMQNKGQAIKTSVVHFKVSPQGITLTDNARKIFFRRHYPTCSVTYCGLDPSAREPHNRRWDASGDRGPPNARVFAFVAKKTGNFAVNVCHLFAELDLDQPAPAIVNFVSKVLIGNSVEN